MDLTIAIPTYNRNELLLLHLKQLLPQLTERCRLLILDNCSPTPVQETLEPLWEQFPHVNKHIIRNKVNIGANANILRCFEQCQSDAIWVLSDDDPPKPNGVALALEHLDLYPDCVLWNFCFDDARSATFCTRGVREMAQKLDLSANLPWVSNCIYAVEPLREQLKFGFQFAFTMLPHLAMLFMALGKEGRCCFSKERLVELQLEGQITHATWSKMVFALSAPTLYDLPLPSDVRELLARKLFITFLGESISLKGVTMELMLEHARRRDLKSTLYYFDQICARGTYFNTTPLLKLQLFLYRLLLRFPHLT
ncbi:MAG: glycosyltransferase, partial [Cytophagaceae bacterium]